MFDKVKNLLDLKRQADALEKEAEKIVIDYQDKGIRILMRGNQRIDKIEVDGVEDKRLKDVLNDSMKELKKKVAKKMQGRLSEFGLPGF